ncbi:hypothetical protein [Planococcus beijingensis]|uniref:hypothetical protein n=1 Tax=Planococcus beijingensis TaxID=2782551 RepID=UPI00193B7827|nr:hypothetical protein [Planococcus beijingensis]
MGDIIAAIFILVPAFIVAFALRWIRIMRINSEKQVEQNEEIISLLKADAREGNR